MAAASYYRIDSFPSTDPTTGSNLYSGHGYDNNPVYPSGPSRPEAHVAHSGSNSYDGNNHHMPPIKPLRPGIQTLQSNSNDYHSTSQFHNGMHSSPTPQPASSNWNARPPQSTDPAAKPLVHSSHVAVPQPLKIQTPNSRIRQRKYQKLKRYLRIGKTITKVITILFSTVIFAIMVYTTIIFETTKTDIRGGRTAWPEKPKTWPTFMLLGCAGITLLLSFITLLSYCCAFDKARRSWKLTVLKYVIHIGSWIVVSALYRYEKSANGVPNDIWGWSCSAKAAALQSQFKGVVTFSTLCSVEVRHRLRLWKEK